MEVTVNMAAIAAPTLAFACPDDVLVDFEATARNVRRMQDCELEVDQLTPSPAISLCACMNLPSVMIGKESSRVISLHLPPPRRS